MRKNIPTLHSEAYFNNRMTQYFDNFEIVYAKERKFPVKEGKKYRRRKEPIACLRAADLAELGNVVSIRTVDGTMDIDTRQDMYFTPERTGELHPVPTGDFTGSWNCASCPAGGILQLYGIYPESQGRRGWQ